MRIFVPLLLFYTFLLHESWTILQFFVADPHKLIAPFYALPDFQIPLSTFFSMACGYLIYCIYAFIIWIDHPSDFTVYFFWLSVLEFFEFFITYNEPWFFIPTPIIKVHFNITMLKLVVLFSLLVKFYHQQYLNKWNLGK
jgi:hypothetical protein